MFTYAERMSTVTGSAIRELLKLLANPDMISFAGGFPAPSTFPASEVARITSDLMQNQGPAVLQYGATEGWMPLRESAVELVKTKGVTAKVENILTLTGSSQGIELLTKVMINPGDAMLVEAPTFLGALQTFNTYQAKIVPLTMDDEGIIIEELEEKIKAHKPKLIYLIPTFQNPTGKTLPLERRKRVAELASKYQTLVIEDDPYGELRYRGEKLPAIKSFDKTGNVIMLNSFSKTVSPGLRVGMAVGEPEVLRKMVIAKQGMDTHTSNLSQAIIDRLLREGLYEPHVKENCEMYKAQMDVMLDAIAKDFPKGVKCTKPDGGLFIWAELPEQIRALDVLNKAIERNVAYIPGEHFFCDGQGKNTIRLNFSMCSPEKIKKGIGILGEIFAEVIA